MLNKVKGIYSCSGEPIWELRSVTCHVRSHSVAGHQTRVNASCLNHSRVGCYSLYLLWMDRGLSLPVAVNVVTCTQQIRCGCWCWLTEMDIVKLKAFIPHLFSQMFVEMLVYGNVTKTVSRCLWSFAYETLFPIKTSWWRIVHLHG